MGKLKHNIVYRLMIVSFFLSVIIGCQSTPKERIVIQEVPVPVAIERPEPPPFERPLLPIHSLKEEDKNNPDKVAEAFVETVKILLQTVDRGKIIIDGLRKEKE